MITSRDVSGNDRHEQPDEVVLHLVANNGAQARYSLFALGLKEIPKTVTLHGRVYNNVDPNYKLNFVEAPAEAEPYLDAPPVHYPKSKNK